MGKTSNNGPNLESNVVPLLSQSVGDAGGALEDAFRRKQNLLIQYLRVRLGTLGDAQDIAQAAFLRLWERRNTLHQNNLESLLFVTARNIANDLLRSRTRRNRWNTESAIECESVADLDSPERALAAKRNLELIRKLLGELPEKCRLAFISYKFEGRGYDEIAREMGVSESMVRKQVLRAVAHCATRFSEMEEWV